MWQSGIACLDVNVDPTFRRGTEGATLGDDVDLLGGDTWHLLSGQFCHKIPGVVF